MVIVTTAGTYRGPISDELVEDEVEELNSMFASDWKKMEYFNLEVEKAPWGIVIGTNMFFNPANVVAIGFEELPQ